MSKSAPIYIGISGFLILILGIACSSFLIPKLEQYLIQKEMALQEGAPTFEQWRKPPFPFKMKVYFFNVSNPDEVQDGSQNPVFKQMGPYIYDEFRTRTVLDVNDSLDSITYMEHKLFYFNQEESGCHREDDIVTIINVGVVSTANKISALFPMALPVFSEGLPYLYPGIKDVFARASVKDILFDGLRMYCQDEAVEAICDALKSNESPATVRLAENNVDYLIALFHHMNGTEDGPYEIERGLSSTIRGRILTYKHSNRLSQWEDECNTIKGTDLTVNPSYVDIPKKIDFFAPDFCRSLSAHFDGEQMYSGLNSFRFKPKYTYGERQECFCAKYKCKKGVMNIEPCARAPITISEPHFLNADKSFLKYAQGLQPDLDKHGTIIVVEPKTGISLSVKIRVQMNVPLRKLEAVSILQNVSEGLFPFIWVEKGAELPDWLLQELRQNFNKMAIFQILKYLLIGAGIFMLCFALIFALFKDRVACFSVTEVGPQNPQGDVLVVEGINNSELYPHSAMTYRRYQAWKN